MIIFPAIDIKDGKVVRLTQGKFDQVKEYAQDPLTVAKQWVDQGAQWLHVVDLDGAQQGVIRNFDIVKKIAKTVNVPVQVGGGIRQKEDIKLFLEAGIKRVILGTKAFHNPDFLKEILALWKNQIAVSLDCFEGNLVENGWTTLTDIKATNFAKNLEKLGLRCLIYTDIKTDGMLQGPNFESIKEILDTVGIDVIASGGISNIDDIKKLRAMNFKNLVGAITGKAIYEGTLNFKEAVKLCSQKE